MKDCQDHRNKQIIDFLIDKRFRVLRHALFLIVFFLIIYAGDLVNNFSLPVAYYVLGATYLTFIAMFYINMYLLVPKFLFKSKYVLYVVFLVILALLGIEILTYFHDRVFGEFRKENLHQLPIRSHYTVLVMCASFISVTTTVKLVQRWVKDKERIAELKNLTFSMELNELRNQVSPHFLFNMLNNVKALIRTDPKMAGEVIMDLSEFLRYQLYESNQDRTLLKTEVDFINNFLNLEQIRKDDLNIEFNHHLTKNQLNSVFIPSGIFTVFVENAIKHSVNTEGKTSFIKTELHIDNKHLHFSCFNSKSDYQYPNNEKNSGLGLSNIKRRLELLYVDDYKLNIESSKNLFIVELSIPI